MIQCVLGLNAMIESSIFNKEWKKRQQQEQQKNKKTLRKQAKLKTLCNLRLYNSFWVHSFQHNDDHEAEMKLTMITRSICEDEMNKFINETFDCGVRLSVLK